MENFLIYLIKASALLILFYVAYQALLKKETFFNTNRWYLLAGLITSTVLPLVSYTKTIWVDPIPRQQVQVLDLEKVLSVQEIGTISPETISINWYDVAAGIYIAGALFLFIRFIFNFISLRKILKGQKAVKKNGFIFIDTQTTETPFSFFNYIVYNSTVLNPEELESILCHEKVHSRQKHSADMIVCQLYCIFFWVNPFTWGYKKTISQNLEFIADSEAIKQLNSRASYQKTLLKITVLPSYTTITNHFYQSLIKKRIVMLNKKQSRKRNSWKYAVILPAIMAFIFLFQIKTVAQEKATPVESISSEKTKISIEVSKDSKDDELTAETNVFKEIFDTEVTFSNVTRNPKNEITGIKIIVKDKSQSKVYEVVGKEPIEPFTIEIEKSSTSANNIIGFGKSNSQKKAFAYSSDENNNDITIPEPFEPLDPVPPLQHHNSIVIPPPPSFNEGNNLVVKTGKNKDALIVLNGVKQKKDELITLPPGEEIVSVNVLDQKEGRKKYGKEGKKGVIEIISQEGNFKKFVLKGPGNQKHSMPVPLVIDRIPEIGDFDGVFTIHEMQFPDIIALHNDVRVLPEFEKEFIINSDVEDFSKEVYEKMQAELKKNYAEMERNAKEIAKDKAELSRKHMKHKKIKSGNHSENEIEQAKRELEKTKKEIEKARVEIEQARKELKEEIRKMKAE